MAETHAAAGHMHDYEAHLRAVEEDLEYYRAKRFEPRIIVMARRGIVTFYDILKAKEKLGHRQRAEPDADMEARIRALEERLDEYVRGIALVSSGTVQTIDLVIEDTRKERGDYDEFFRIRKKDHPGTLEERLANVERDLRDYQMLLDAFTAATIEKGLVDEAELRKKREAFKTPGVWNGGRIVARAWADPAFKSDLLERGRAAIRDLGIHQGKVGKVVVVENTDSLHNVVVCTLCSCYPYDLLGDTPWWYKHDSYKRRIIADPRRTLEEMFGLGLPAAMDVRVHDSTSDVRYMVLPRRPKGTEALSEEELIPLVTVDSLIGAGECIEPARIKAAEDPDRSRSPRRPRDY